MRAIRPQRESGADAVEETRPPLRAIAFLPSAATLGNMICGFLAIFCCLLSLRGEYIDVPLTGVHGRLSKLVPAGDLAIAAYLIVAAMIFDALDGRLARIARRTSEFGAQLDSVADMVSFGAAPAMMLITLLMQLAVIPGADPLVSTWHWRVGMTASILYVSCAAIRLARYNAENVKDESGQKRFSGLPSPGAAGALVALFVLHEQLRVEGNAAFGVDWPSVIRWIMPFAAAALGALMVSRMDYVHVFNVYVRREHPPIHLLWLVLICVIGWFFFEYVLVALAYVYVISGLVLNVRHWLERRRAIASTASRPPAVN